MTAIVMETKGGPEVLKPVRRSVPRPATGEVLIAVAAAGVNRPDVVQRSGAVPAPVGVSNILGLEVAGRIVACGEAVGPALLGTEVMALVKAGGYASHVCARADHCLPIPSGLSIVEAAALPEGLFTIWHNLFDRGELRSGETVLLEGGASGIGTLALQLVKSVGGTVIATAGGPEKCARLAAMGVDAIDYHGSSANDLILAATGGRGVDVVLDILGGDAVNRHLEIMAEGGRHVGLSFMAGATASIDLGLVMRKGLWLTSSTLRPKSDAEKASIARSVIKHLLPLLGPNAVRPVISSVLPLDKAADAHRLLESGKNFGKIVLQMPEAA
ncbi:NAD(P)H-quinone oxidoreductase (plasmid) [Rhizobium bangladeshense]|uniref:NAD(P)H-quinone oxidoreductase n=1 Tax=Rhizobium bangladeshense TaxID=1138189 RepID=UPI001A99E4CF|nr:NAD(P)H-quinone oxidoreductase [Rhizobium bangladeshense]QSY98042.1 NAD(P)H-quinone oxidoreductase [Rhizobium bangladeshense]